MWEWDWAQLPSLLLTLLISCISLVFSYQNVAITRFHRIQLRYEPAAPVKRPSDGGARREEETAVLERVAVWYAISSVNAAFLVVFAGLMKVVFEPMKMTRSIGLITLAPTFIIGFFTKL